MKKLMLFVGTLCVCAALSYGQGNNDAAKDSKPKGPRVEDVTENGHRMLRFFDKSGKKAKEIPFESKDVTIRVARGRTFDPVDYKIKVSTQLAHEIENMRKESRRDVALIRKEAKEARFVKDGRFLVTEESVSDFIEPADADDSERAESPAEFSQVSRVYDKEGNKILELSGEEGWQPVVSNTGQYFVVTIGNYLRHRIINRNREILADMPYHVGNKFFSDNDRYIILTNKLQKSNMCELTVFDTANRKLELKKQLLPWRMFQNIENKEIKEETRDLVIHYIGDSGKASKVERVRF